MDNQNYLAAYDFVTALTVCQILGYNKHIHYTYYLLSNLSELSSLEFVIIMRQTFMEVKRFQT